MGIHPQNYEHPEVPIGTAADVRGCQALECKRIRRMSIVG
jgi:hypothetical protein